MHQWTSARATLAGAHASRRFSSMRYAARNQYRAPQDSGIRHGVSIDRSRAGRIMFSLGRAGGYHSHARASGGATTNLDPAPCRPCMRESSAGGGHAVKHDLCGTSTTHCRAAIPMTWLLLQGERSRSVGKSCWYLQEHGAIDCREIDRQGSIEGCDVARCICAQEQQKVPSCADVCEWPVCLPRTGT